MQQQQLDAQTASHKLNDLGVISLMTDIRPPPAPWKKRQAGATLTLSIAENLRDVPFAAWFGELQLLTSHPASERDAVVRRVVLDFSPCRWADPLPLLQLAIWTREFIAMEAEHKVDIFLPNKYSRPQFMKFLAQEGFLAAFLSIDRCECWMQGKRLRAEDVGDIAKLSHDLAYCNCYIIGAHILDLGSTTVPIDEWINDTTSKLHLALVNRCPSWSLDSVVYKVRFILHETLHNVALHAYPDWHTNTRYVGIYIRYRSGMESAHAERRDVIAATSASESRECHLDSAYLRSREGFVEVFVCDSGIGIAGSISRRNSEQDVKNESDRSLARRTFEKVLKTKYTDRSASSTQSEAGGLYHLHHLLAVDQDFLRGLDADVWVSQQLPFTGYKQPEAPKTPYANGLDACGVSMRGLSWTFRLGWLSATDVKADVFKHWEGALDHHPLLMHSHTERRAELDTIQAHFKDKTVVIIDQDRSVARGPFKQQLSADLTPKTKCVMIFTPIGLAKNYLLRMVEDIDTASHSTELAVMLVDIPRAEEATYALSLENAKFPAFKSIQSVTIITRRLGALRYSASRRERWSILMISHEHTSRFLSASGLPYDGPDTAFPLACKYIKFWDSYLLWTEVRQRAERTKTSAFINESVHWGQELELSGYLDFSQTLASHRCVEIYLRCIERLEGALRGTESVVVAGDSLVKSLIAAHSARRRGGDKRALTIPGHVRKLVLVSSISVTGVSHKLVMNEHGHNCILTAAISFFIHHSSPQKGGLALLQWAKPEWLSSLDRTVSEHMPGGQYMRLGKTPMIAKGGVNYFRIPRGKPWQLESLQSYDMWQRMAPSVVKIGHWAYGSNHDLMTIDIWKELHFSADADHGMVRFIIGRILSHLKIKPSELTANGPRARSYLPEIGDDCDECLLLVYISHDNTDFLVRELLDVLPASYSHRVIAISGVREMRTSSTLLMSPLAHEQVNRLLQGAAVKTVLLLDDALISGQTCEQARALLLAAGATRVIRLALFDRRRLPTDRLGNEEFFYARFDVPTLGTRRYCPLCTGIARAKEFARNAFFVSRVVDRWIRQWSACSPISGWASHGLTPLGVSIKTPELPYRTTSNADGSIRISSTVGAAVYFAENHCLKYDDGTVIDFIASNATSLSASAKIQILATQLLLFAEEFAPSIRSEMLFQLLEAATHLSDHAHSNEDAHLSLVGITIFAQEEGSLKSLADAIEQRNLFVSWERRLREDLSLQRESEDLLIAVAFLLSRLGGPLMTDSGVTQRASRLLRSLGTSNADKYDLFYRELYDEEGGVHRQPLGIIKIHSGPDISSPAFRGHLRDAYISCLRLDEHIRGIGASTLWFRPLVQSADPLKIMNECLRAVSSCSDEIQRYLAIETPAWTPDFEKVQTEVTSLIRATGVFRDGILARVVSNDVNDGTQSIVEADLHAIISRTSADQDWSGSLRARNLNTDRFSSSSGKPEFRESKSGEGWPTQGRQFYVVWDSMVVQIIQQTLCNVIHSSACIDDPWHDEGGTADMWLRVRYFDSCITLTAANGVVGGLEDRGSRVSAPYLEECGVRTIRRIVGNICFTHIWLPYAGRRSHYPTGDLYSWYAKLEEAI